MRKEIPAEYRTVTKRDDGGKDSVLEWRPVRVRDQHDRVRLVRDLQNRRSSRPVTIRDRSTVATVRQTSAGGRRPTRSAKGLPTRVGSPARTMESLGLKFGG